ncbi:hypothetical protein ACEUDN_03670 [Aeromonas hydrophila]|uniref:hypothetical protein n=1 Tax=Aeromonas hydrophila TaxID=644 RepID=UPI0038D1D638
MNHLISRQKLASASAESPGRRRFRQPHPDIHEWVIVFSVILLAHCKLIVSAIARVTRMRP